MIYDGSDFNSKFEMILAHPRVLNKIQAITEHLDEIPSSQSTEREKRRTRAMDEKTRPG